ncbi:MAG: 30S ribosome-binding factor RbfA, partial [Candidatus Cloacimonetes bacterium]|nr:30S ribosome-binding factor RbfA [Candidatus Cloacimonadota bacterium]
IVRLERLQKELHHLVDSLFQGSISDSRLSGIDITTVKLSHDLGHLKLYFTNINKDNKIDTTIELLNKSSGFIKKKIAGAKLMRTIPQIAFEYDNTNDKAEKIDKLLRIIAEEKRNQNYYEDDSDNDYYDDDDEIYDEDLEDYDDYNDELDDELDYDYDDDVDEDSEDINEVDNEE